MVTYLFQTTKTDSSKKKIVDIRQKEYMIVSFLFSYVEVKYSLGLSEGMLINLTT